jgi:NifB/MoaA-like Fe-S oxidoreductase
VPVPNRFFGETVTVAGLLTAEDVVDALTGVTLGDAICLPLSMLDRAGGVTLDGRSSAWLGQRLDTPVFFADTISDLLPRR